MRIGFLTFGLLTACLGACTTTSGDATEAAGDESDVVVKRCPSEVDIDLGKPQVYRAAPTTLANGTSLSDAEKTRIRSVMHETRARKGISTNLKMSRTSGGTCFYTGAQGGESATFSTKNGEAIFHVYEPGGLELFLFPKNYTIAGLEFEANDTASLFANVGASGPFGDGATVSVKIGNAAIESTKTPSPNEYTLVPGNNPEVANGPDYLSIIANAPDVVGKVTSSTLATCSVTKTGGDAKQTQFKLTLDYENDDGFNGCEFSFDDAKGFHADIRVGMTVDD